MRIRRVPPKPRAHSFGAPRAWRPRCVGWLQLASPLRVMRPDIAAFRDPKDGHSLRAERGERAPILLVVTRSNVELLAIPLFLSID